MTTSVESTTKPAVAYSFDTDSGSRYHVFTDGSARRHRLVDDGHEVDGEFPRIVFIDSRYLPELWRLEYDFMDQHPEIPATTRPAVGLAPMMLNEVSAALFDGTTLKQTTDPEEQSLLGTPVVRIEGLHEDFHADEAEMLRVSTLPPASIESISGTTSR